jgi:hypothetical protein
MILASQAMYMMPSRRAIAALLPCASVARSQFSTAAARALSAGLSMSTAQSHARPSACSLTSPWQGLTIP